ncbi:ABC transporter substrate-binding protein [Arthrobacter sp. 35W]|uniref:ABC transporter substrate-binding protein n=1 Tax=Arthrobacter sp. 35W TaxID=1132441 RepID=UPI0004254D84|nr:extracellular solute-binding protein [Arthrobacter sp. 35W]
MIKNVKRRRNLALTVTACLSVSVLALSGCAQASGSQPTAGGDTATKLSILVTTENTQVPAELKKLADKQCSTQSQSLPLSIEQAPSASIQEKIQLLAGQDALPVMFAAGNSYIDKGGDLQKNGQILDVEGTFKDLGILDQITPSALSTLKKLYTDTVPSLPFQYNIEGIWYNKKIFDANNIAVPTTWSELTAASEKLKKAGVTPITASGQTGWTISRWIGAYLFRSLGQNAMLDVKEGRAKLTDAKYVEAAKAIQDLAKAGYFPEGVSGIDYDTANNQFLSGQAAMMYMGSWLLAKVNDPAQNKIGDAAQFMPFPEVSGGKGKIDEYPANAGSPTSVNPKMYGPKVGDWIKCIATNYGADSLQNSGTFSGFKVNGTVDAVPPITADIQKRIDASTSSVLWFEALFNAKATQDAKDYAAAFLTGSTSAQDYMSLLQKDLDTAH